jgi:hypothetical protein
MFVLAAGMYGLLMLSSPLIYNPHATMMMKAMKDIAASILSLVDSSCALHKSFAV